MTQSKADRAARLRQRIEDLQAELAAVESSGKRRRHPMEERQRIWAAREAARALNLAHRYGRAWAAAERQGWRPRAWETMTAAEAVNAVLRWHYGRGG